MSITLATAPLTASVKAFSTAYAESDCSFAFEFVPMDVESTYQANADFNESLLGGFAAVDATGVLEVPYNGELDKVFFIKSDDDDGIRAGSINPDAIYGILGESSGVNAGVDPFASTWAAEKLKYSMAMIGSGKANTAPVYAENTKLKDDYVRKLAKDITGGYALSDIFANEVDLLSGVSAMDVPLNAALSSKINSATVNSSVKTDAGPQACKGLVDGLLSLTTVPAGPRRERGEQFLADLAAQSAPGMAVGHFWVKFHPGDVIALRLTYKAKDGAGNPAKDTEDKAIGENAVHDRTYKVFLKLKAPVV